MITRRRVLAATGGLALAAAGPAVAQTPIDVPTPRRNDMEIKRNGSQPSGKGPADYFTGDGPHRPAVRGARTGARSRRQRHVRAGRPHRLAYASARPDLDRHVRPRLGAALGRPDRGNPARRRRLVSARREALARRRADDGDDAYRHSGSAQRQSRRLDGKGQRRAIPEPDAAEAVPTSEDRSSNNAKAQTWKERPGSIGHRPRLHGTDLRLRSGHRTSRQQSRSSARRWNAASHSSIPPRSTARSPTRNSWARRSLRSASKVVIATKFGFELDPEGGPKRGRPEQSAGAHQSRSPKARSSGSGSIASICSTSTASIRRCRSKTSPAR